MECINRRIQNEFSCHSLFLFTPLFHPYRHDYIRTSNYFMRHFGVLMDAFLTVIKTDQIIKYKIDQTDQIRWKNIIPPAGQKREI